MLNMFKEVVGGKHIERRLKFVVSVLEEVGLSDGFLLIHSMHGKKGAYV